MGLSPSLVWALFNDSSSSHGQTESKRLGTADRRASLRSAAAFYLDFCKTLTVYDLQNRDLSCIKKMECFVFTETDSQSIPFLGEKDPHRLSGLARRVRLPTASEMNFRSSRMMRATLDE